MKKKEEEKKKKLLARQDKLANSRCRSGVGGNTINKASRGQVDMLRCLAETNSSWLEDGGGHEETNRVATLDFQVKFVNITKSV